MTTRDLWAADLPGAVERGEFTAHYQPQFDLRTRRIVAVEALARWTHPRFGPIAPDEFIAEAERTGTIGEIGRFMLRTACSQLTGWAAQGVAMELAINVSPIELAHPAFTGGVLALLDECGSDPRAVTLEVTETLPVDTTSQLLDGLETVRSAGMGISIDDFGVGYASIERVRDLRATELKIDKTLIRDGGAAGLDGAIEEARLAGVRIVAEGIETDAHLQRAVELQCDRVQGYLLGRPVPADQLALTA